MNLEEQLNFYGEKKEPFFFIINYDKSEYEVIPLNQLPKNIKYNITENKKTLNHNQILEKNHMNFDEYNNKFIQLKMKL